MSPFQRLLLLVLVGGLLIMTWLGRYSIVVQSGDGPARAYKLDRWTGQVEFLHAEESYPVRPYLPGKP